MTDEDLLGAFVRDRSRAAFEEILRRHGGLVYGVCRRTLGDLQEAEDAAQSVFLIFLEKAPRLGRGTVVAAWLYRTAVFVSRNQIRARIRRDHRLPEPATPVEPAWEEARPHLDDALARLPQRLQDALVVHYLQGKTLVETAATLDCPVKTLEKRVGRGLQRLRELLAGAGVAITSAALIALLETEARGATPARIGDALRSAPLPAAAAGIPLLRKLLFPATAAIVVAGLVAGALRMTASDRWTPEATAPRLAADAEAARPKNPKTSVPAPALEPAAASATRRPFPANFDELRVLFKRLIECPEDVERWEVLGIGVRREDLRAVLQGNDYDENWVDPMIVDLFKEWAGREPRPAADWLYRAYALLPTTGEWRIERPDGFSTGNVTLLHAVLDAWVRREPGAAEAWLKTLPPGLARNAIVVELAIVATRQNPDRSADFAAILDELPPTWARRVATAEVAQEWAKRDPKAAAAWILKLPARGPDEGVRSPTFTLDEPGSDRGLPPLASLDHQVLGDRDNPEFATPRNKEQELIEARLSALTNIAHSWAESDLAAARLWSENLEDPIERSSAMSLVGGVWAETDPRAVLDYARAHPEADWSSYWLTIVAKTLIERDRAGAESVIRLVSPEHREAMWVHVLETLVRARPEEAAREAIDAMLKLDWSEAQGHYNGILWRSLDTWVKRNPRDAAACAEAIPKSEVRGSVLSIVGQYWAASDPRAALDWVLRLPEESRGSLVGFAAGELAATDLERARRMAAPLTESQGRSHALYKVATAWGRTAPESALAWAKSMPVEERDQRIVDVLAAWAERDADAALAQVGTIADEEKRTLALESIHESRRGAERAKLRKSLLRREEGK